MSPGELTREARGRIVREMSTARRKEHYSWQDYLSWSGDERFELVDGAAYAMSPAPQRRHQRVVSELNRQIANALLKSACQVYPAPFDVKLSGEEADDAPTVVQPDLTVICDEVKLTEQGVSGAPDLVIEIVSPDSGYHDRVRKFDLYQRYGVAEYWLVDESEHVLEVFELSDTGSDTPEYRRVNAYGSQDTVQSTAVAGLKVELEQVFRGETR